MPLEQPSRHGNRRVSLFNHDLAFGRQARAASSAVHVPMLGAGYRLEIPCIGAYPDRSQNTDQDERTRATMRMPTSERDQRRRQCVGPRRENGVREPLPRTPRFSAGNQFVNARACAGSAAPSPTPNSIRAQNNVTTPPAKPVATGSNDPDGRADDQGSFRSTEAIA